MKSKATKRAVLINGNATLQEKGFCDAKMYQVSKLLKLNKIYISTHRYHRPRTRADNILSGIGKAVEELEKVRIAIDFINIMTTDTKVKQASISFEIEETIIALKRQNDYLIWLQCCANPQINITLI